VNLIHRDDTVDATIAVIEKNISLKTINVVSSEHPTREEYYSHYCRTHQLPLPEFDPDDSTTGKIVPNDELLSFYLPKKKL
jgi:nucleoside-diphosphate-sugar epimerase